MDVKIKDGLVHLSVSVRAPVVSTQAWRLLTAYEELHGYMPGIDSSRIVGQTDTSCVVRQVMTTRIVIPWSFRVEMELLPAPELGILRFRQVRGSLRGYAGRWEVIAMGPAECEVRYQATARLKRRFPAMVVSYIARRQMERMMPALVDELVRRRDAEASAGAPGS